MVSAFFADLITIAPPVGRGTNAFANRLGERIGFVQMIPESSNALRIHRIWTLRPNQGDGSAMLNEICNLADRHSIVLKLKTLPFGSKPYPLTCDALVDWYRRHGFEGKRRKMVREPKRFRRFAQPLLASYIGE